MATRPGRRQRPEEFHIHEDVPSTQDTEMSTDALQEEEGDDEQEEDEEDQPESDEPDQEEDGQDDVSDEETPDHAVQVDMENLQGTFPGFRHKYRLIKRIGEGTFSTVYKAEDLQYDHYDNTWDLDKENEKWTHPPLKRDASRSSTTTHDKSTQPRRRSKFVAIKKIYVTSSPQRILNEIELLHDLRNCPAVCSLITAFRNTDQVVVILPYFRHQDFRDYFRDMTVPDMALYLRSLFTALSAVHASGVLHRDIKPTNFLYDKPSRRGVLVDFGLAEREGVETKPCLCHDERSVRNAKLRSIYVGGGPHNGYPKNDTRPSRRANRAGTRGFRAPEVLFKCTEQSSKIDIWSAGVILLTILSRRFPFFNSADDVEAMIEIATIFGQKKMRTAAQLHGCMFESTLPTIGMNGFELAKIVMWSTVRDEKTNPFTAEEKIAVHFLRLCMELDPSRRISADEALEHDFLRMGLDDQGVSQDEDDEEMDILKV